MATRSANASFEIRRAAAQDAAAICAVVRDSITMLCGADHGDDPEILESWLANKTPDNVGGWIANPDNAIFVAVRAGAVKARAVEAGAVEAGAVDTGAVVAAGCVTQGGNILLNYVSPAARFRGVSKALMQALEDWARLQGNARCTLDSTRTARGFYQALGYAENGEPCRKHGVGCYPMVKSL
jgi:GNAT superfamily N-acetyltransferase